MTYCTNISCPAQMFRWITHFAGVMDIEGLGEQWVAIFLDKGLIKDPADIYSLTQEQLVALDRMGDKSASKLLRTSRHRRRRTWAACSSRWGSATSAGKWRTFSRTTSATLDALANASQEEITQVEGIGPKIAESVYRYFQDDAKRAIIEKLRKAGVNFEQKRPKKVEGPANRKSFVFTGTLAAMPRGKAEALVASLGADAVGSVTRKVTYVVAGADPGSKLQKAEGYGIPVLDEDGFWKLMKQHGVKA